MSRPLDPDGLVCEFICEEREQGTTWVMLQRFCIGSGFCRKDSGVF